MRSYLSFCCALGLFKCRHANVAVKGACIGDLLKSLAHIRVLPQPLTMFRSFLPPPAARPRCRRDLPRLFKGGQLRLKNRREGGISCSEAGRRFLGSHRTKGSSTQTATFRHGATPRGLSFDNLRRGLQLGSVNPRLSLAHMCLCADHAHAASARLGEYEAMPPMTRPWSSLRNRCSVAATSKIQNEPLNFDCVPEGAPTASSGMERFADYLLLRADLHRPDILYICFERGSLIAIAGPNGEAQSRVTSVRAAGLAIN